MQNIAGASYTEELTSLTPTRDGGFLFGGTSSSDVSGNKTSANHGLTDFWVVRTDADGNILWDRSVGGSKWEALSSVKETADGGFILGGTSSSPADGNKTSPSFGTNDFWIARLDSAGNKLWDRAFGGANSDELADLQLTSDGGFILGGTTYSGISGNKSTPMRGTAFYSDYWVVRLDADGNKLWDQTVGGDFYDRLTTVRQTPDGGFLLGGWSTSHLGGNKTSPSFTGHEGGAPDFWLVRLDGNGNKLWDQTYGGTDSDTPYALEPTADGGFIVGGESISTNNGNKTAPNRGHVDYWVIKAGGESASLRLRPELPFNPATGFRFRAIAEADYFYRTDYSEELLHWMPLQTNALVQAPLIVTDLGASGASQRFYRVVRLPGRQPSGTIWRQVSLSGVARSSQLYLFLQSPGDVYLDDIQFVPGSVAETGPNLVRNGDFESALSGSWQVSGNYSNSSITTDYHRSGNTSLHLVASNLPIRLDTIVIQEMLPITTNTTHTLSFWYLPTTTPINLVVRLSDNSMSVTTNLVYYPPPP